MPLHTVTTSLTSLIFCRICCCGKNTWNISEYHPIMYLIDLNELKHQISFNKLISISHK